MTWRWAFNTWRMMESGRTWKRAGGPRGNWRNWTLVWLRVWEWGWKMTEVAGSASRNWWVIPYTHSNLNLDNLVSFGVFEHLWTRHLKNGVLFILNMERFYGGCHMFRKTHFVKRDMAWVGTLRRPRSNLWAYFPRSNTVDVWPKTPTGYPQKTV